MSERQKYPWSPEPIGIENSSFDKNKQIIVFGNTGLYLVVVPNSINTTTTIVRQHFTPENLMVPNKKKQLEFSYVYVLAFDRALVYLETEFSKVMGIRNPEFLSGSTNDTMSTFRRNLFGQYYRVTDRIFDENTYLIDLKLMNDNAVRQRMTRLINWGDQRGYTTDTEYQPWQS